MGFDTATVRAELLDCMQANIAVLADRWYGAGHHLRLGAVLRFRPRPLGAGLTTVEPPIREQLADAMTVCGLTARETWARQPASTLRELADRHGPLYVVADAYSMPWLPYFGRAHMAHSYLLEPVSGGVEVTDAYYNQTAWGTARPSSWTLDPGALPDADLVLSISPGPAAAASPRPVAEFVDPSAYVAGYREHADRSAALDRLTVETWLLARARKLHAAFRAAGEGPDAAATEHLQRWDALTSSAFVAQRRVQRGKREPATLWPELAAVLAADRTLFGAVTPVESAALTADS